MWTGTFRRGILSADERRRQNDGIFVENRLFRAFHKNGQIGDAAVAHIIGYFALNDDRPFVVTVECAVFNRQFLAAGKNADALFRPPGAAFPVKIGNGHALAV